MGGFNSGGEAVQFCGQEWCLPTPSRSMPPAQQAFVLWQLGDVAGSKALIDTVLAAKCAVAPPPERAARQNVNPNQLWVG